MQSRSPELLLRAQENSFVRRTDGVDSASHGPERRRHPVRLLRGRAGDGRGADASRSPATPAGSGAASRRSGRRGRCAARAPARARLLRPLPGARLRAARPVLRRLVKRATYSHYMDKVSTIAQQSTTDGKSAVTALTTPGLTVAQMVAKLRNIAAAEQQNVRAAQSLAPPGRLRDEHAHLIEALQLRVSGVSSLADAFQSTAADRARAEIEVGRRRLDLARRRRAAAARERRRLGRPVQGAGRRTTSARRCQRCRGSRVALPGEPRPDHQRSTRWRSYSSGSAARRPRARRSASTAPNLVSVAALPNGTGGTSQVLTRKGTLNTVTTSSSLVFQVTIHDGGDFQEVQIPVTLTIARPAAQGGRDHQDREGPADRSGPGRLGHVQRSRPGAVCLADDRVGRRRGRARGDEQGEQLRTVQSHLLAALYGE